MGQAPYGFEVVGQVGGAGPRIVVVDVDAAGIPTFVAQSDALPGVVEVLAAARDPVFAAYASGIPYDRTGGLAVLNVAAPSRPQVRGTFPITSTIEGIAVSGDIVALVGSRVHRPPTAAYARWAEVMHVVDASDRPRPRRAASIAYEHPGPASGVIVQPFRGGAMGVAMDGRYAHVSPGRDGTATSVRVVDLTDPEHPIVQASTVVPGKPEGLVARREQLFVSGERPGLRVLAADPADLREVCRLPMSSEAARICQGALHRDLLAVVDPCAKRLRVVSPADPERPFAVGAWPIADGT